MLLNIVFSFRNEECNIPELVKRVNAAVSTIADLSYEMIFVNDASTDQSLALLLELRKTYPITIVNMSRKFGVTPCVLAGLSFCKGDAVVYMDSDLQDPPELIPELVKCYRDGADVVHTRRISREGEGRIKMLLTRLAYRVINFFSDMSLPENVGDFKLLSSRVVSQILSLGEYDPYMRGLSVWVGFKQAYVPYRREKRWGGEAKFPLLSKNPAREFVRGLTAFSAAPLWVAFVVGVICCLMALGLIIWAIGTKLLGIASPGASGVLIAVSFFSGMILISNGLIGLYVSRIYYQVKGRPRFIVESVVGAGDKSD